MNGRGIIAFGDEAGLAPVLDAVTPDLIVYDPDRPGMTEFSHTLGIPCRPHPGKEDIPAFTDMIRHAGGQLGVISSYSRILPEALIAAFPLGVLNLHLSRLPEYRGANTLQWTLINGETETDATLHYIDAGVDTGPVLARERVEISPDDTALTLRDKLLAAGARLMQTWLPRAAAQHLPATPQDEARARRWPRRTPADGRIDAGWSAERIVNMSRALVAPWPAPYYEDAQGRRIEVAGPLTLPQARELIARMEDAS